MPNVNPNILRWARTTAGLSAKDAARKLGIRSAYGIESVDRLAALEDGQDAPSRTMLEKMSKHYRRPLLTFYLSEPPRTGAKGQDFRTLPEAVNLVENAFVDTVLREIRVRQSLVRMILEEEEEAERFAFVNTAKIGEEPSALAIKIKKTLRFDVSVYWRKRTAAEAVSYLRKKVEGAGIFVPFVDNLGNYRTEVPVELFRGFALADEIAPFIVVNANDSKGAQAFTIVHELVHIWLGLTGVSGGKVELRVEKYCNDVAGEFLLPGTELEKLNVRDGFNSQEILRLVYDFARKRNISGNQLRVF